MRTDKIRKYLIPNIPYLFILWAFLKLGTAYRLAAGNDFAHKLIGLGQTIGPAFADFAPGLAPLDWLVGIVGAVGFRLLIYFKSKNAKKFRRDAEYGSARWGDPRTIGKKYRDRRHREKNILLTQHVALGLDGRITKRNTHQLIVGGSGAGKTRYFCLPNVMNACCSYIITDCKGEILRAVGGLLEKQGIPFTVLDLVNMRGHYNPFAYLRRDSDALRLVTNLVANTTPKDAKNSDPFWDRAETALLQALILYLKHRAPVCEQNFTMVMEMINAAEVREGDLNFKSALDLLFDELESDDPQSIALKQYKVFKQAQDKTAKSILIGAAVRLAAFNLPELARVTDSDEMYIGRLGEEKRAIFCVIPDNDTSLNFLVSMLYTCAHRPGRVKQ